MSNELISGVVSQQDWSLYRKGEADQERHKQKLNKVLKKNLADIIADEGIIMSDGKKVVKVPVRSLDQYKFVLDPNSRKSAGTGKGDSKKGDIIYQKGKGTQGKGKGPGAGEEAGDEYYEAEITIEELQALLFEDLGLPYLDPTKKPEFVVEKIRFDKVRKTGLMNNLDKRRTILNTIKRNALAGNPGVKPIKPEDLRFKTWSKKLVPKSNAVILAMMDVSGSMGNYEKYIARSFFFWMSRFLRTKYTNVEIVFIAHHTEAKVVTEEQFFHRGESGGTMCSSAYTLALDLVAKYYSPQDYNIYAFHFSDGDNWGYDNPKAISELKKLCEVCNAVGYGEIVSEWSGNYTTLFKLYQEELVKRIGNFNQVIIKDKSDVYGALHAFFRPSWDTDAEFVNAPPVALSVIEERPVAISINYLSKPALPVGAIEPYPTGIAEHCLREPDFDARVAKGEFRLISEFLGSFTDLPIQVYEDREGIEIKRYKTLYRR